MPASTLCTPAWFLHTVVGLRLWVLWGSTGAPRRSVKPAAALNPKPAAAHALMHFVFVKSTSVREQAVVCTVAVLVPA